MSTIAPAGISIHLSSNESVNDQSPIEQAA
jgi:hypothetical protein